MLSTLRIRTLMRREWLQHRIGWLAVAFAPAVIFLACAPFSHFEVEDAGPPTALALMILCITAICAAGLAWIVSMFQLPGLARRDIEDRSIEFWLSLPGQHAEHIGSSLVMHAFLAPLLALWAGTLVGLPIAAVLVTKISGPAAFSAVDWSHVLMAAVPVLLRLSLGVVLMVLWYAPLTMVMMAASAWAKRWGAPMVIAVIVCAGVVLHKLYNNPIVWLQLKDLTERGNHGFFMSQVSDELATRLLTSPPAEVAQVMWTDAAHALQAWLSIEGVVSLGVAAIGWWIVQEKRRHVR